MTPHKHQQYILTGLIGMTLAGIGMQGCVQKQPENPNILWITCEDITPMLSIYGDKTAQTPYLDSLARKGAMYMNAFANAPVCSPSRSTLITGVYSTTLGSQHLRSDVKIPEKIKTYPFYLSQAGYFCTNNDKEDYNFTDSTIWNESSKKATWHDRAEGQPFFSIINLEITHQSKIFGSDSVYHERIKDYLPYITPTSPDAVVPPPYYPDSPEVRKLWARYYTNVSIMDYQTGQILKQLRDEHLDDNTIVFFYSDHGTGMPRSKRAVYDSGLQVPMIIYVPEKYRKALHFKPGTKEERLVSFLDLGPTVLSIVGIEKPGYMQGQAFMGKYEQPPQKYVYGTSDRVDEAFETSRTVRSKNFRYIRNFMPQLPLLQPNYYTDKSLIMKELTRLKDEGNLTPAQQDMFAATRAPEELYDANTDPYEIHNLAASPAFHDTLLHYRKLMDRWVMDTYDTGLMPEPIMHKLAEGSTPYAVAHDSAVYPLRKILDVTSLMIPGNKDDQKLVEYLGAVNQFVRYWAVITAESNETYDQNVVKALKERLTDEVPLVKIEAAAALIKAGQPESEPLKVIENYLRDEDSYVQLYAARA
ncbi:MAG TPA: sulfatase-like hydrolase/transferase, partial [Bacteroidales bacterium]|nr:sulfatase-like hydrolase/transferase [Bacteroidales bacterium]